MTENVFLYALNGAALITVKLCSTVLCLSEWAHWVKQPFLPQKKKKHRLSLSFILMLTLGNWNSYSGIYHLQSWLMQQHPLWHSLQNPAVHPTTWLLPPECSLPLSCSIILPTPPTFPVGYACGKACRSICFSLHKELFNLCGLFNYHTHSSRTVPKPWSHCKDRTQSLTRL